MKKLILVFLVMLSLVSYVNAGDTHYLDFSNNKKVAILTIAEGDIVRFMFPVREYYMPTINNGKEQIEFREKEEEQIFMLREVKENKEKRKLVDVTTFIAGAQTPYYTTLNQKTKLQLDFDLDRVTDMEVRVLDFNEEKNATFEFIVSNKDHANYNPIKYVNKTGGLPGVTSAGSGFDSVKASIGKLKNSILNNIELSAIAVITLLILAFNRRHIENILRRTF